jgi:hypothetical protein
VASHQHMRIFAALRRGRVGEGRALDGRVVVFCYYERRTQITFASSFSLATSWARRAP